MSFKLNNKMLVKRHMLHERIGKGRSSMLAARGKGSHRTPVPPTILSNLYWSIAIPRMTYGLEVVPMEDSHIDEIVQVHRVRARIIQLPENVHKPTVLSTIGSMSMPAYIAYRKLLFLLSILSLSVNNIYRRIVVAILVSCDIFGTVKLSPIGGTFKYICKYGLKDLFMSCIIRNDGNSKEMKTQQKRTIWEYEIYCRKATQLIYPERDPYYKMVRNISVNVWWQIAARNPISTSKIGSVAAIAGGTQPRGLQCNFRCKQCRLCCEQRLDHAMHIIFQRCALEATRIWAAVLDVLPNAMAADISHKSWHAVLHLTLSEFWDQYIPEWNQLISTLHVSYIQCIKGDTKCTEIFKNCNVYIYRECNSGRVLCMNSSWLARILGPGSWLAGGTAAKQPEAGLWNPCWRAGMGFGMAFSWWPSQLNL